MDRIALAKEKPAYIGGFYVYTVGRYKVPARSPST
jgi:hypothetical protein